MKKAITILAAVLAVNAVLAVEVTDQLLDAIETVESHGNTGAIGDGGKAFGAYQLHKSYVEDFNRFFHKSYSHVDAFSRQKAREMVKLYLEKYGRAYERKTGKKATPEVLARIHNGGPVGWKKETTKPYWNKIKKAGKF